jgi:hypothetical protein
MCRAAKGFEPQWGCEIGSDCRTQPSLRPLGVFAHHLRPGIKGQREQGYVHGLRGHRNTPRFLDGNFWYGGVTIDYCGNYQKVSVSWQYSWIGCPNKKEKCDGDFTGQNS